MAWQVEWLILWTMIVKILTHIHMVVYTCDVSTFTKEMKLELMWIHSTMKRRREGFETSPV